MLIDPAIVSDNEMNNLFNLLNKDDINIVFDANAEDNITNPLNVDLFIF